MKGKYHDLPFQWYFDGNAQQDARTQTHHHHTDLRQNHQRQDK